MLAENGKINIQGKNFYSDFFELIVDFHPSGGISGKLLLLSDLHKCCEVSGLYSVIESRIILSFMNTYNDSSSELKILSVFSGELIKYQDNVDCLLLKSLSFSDAMEGKIENENIQVFFDTKLQADSIENLKKSPRYLFFLS